MSLNYFYYHSYREQCMTKWIFIEKFVIIKGIMLSFQETFVPDLISYGLDSVYVNLITCRDPPCGQAAPTITHALRNC